MAPRNRPSPSTSPGTAGLTKKQRQALRIQRPAAASSSPNTDAASSDVESAVPSAGTSPASMPVEGIRIQRYVAAAEERERASPSKYPTPLPDEEEDELPMLPPVEVEAAAEEVPVFEVDVEDMEDKAADVAVPVGSLIDVFDEEDDAPAPAALSPVLERSEPDVAHTAGVSQGQAALRPKELSVSPPAPPQSHPPQPAETQADPAPPPPKAPRTRTPPPPQPSLTPFPPQGVGGPPPAAPSAHVRTPPRAPTVAGHVRQTSGQGHAQAAAAHGQPAGYGHHAHLRAPEAPRSAPPRALALGALSLSHTLRSALAASTQAVTSTATAYAHAYANSSSGYSAAAAAAYPAAGGRRVSGNGDGGGVRDGEGEGETILGARWDEVAVEGEVDGPRPTTRRLLTLTYAAGVQVWDASSLGGVEELLNLRIPLPLPSSQTATSTLGRAAGTGIERTNSLRGAERSRSSVDTLRAVDVGNVDKQRKGAKQDEGQEAGEEMFGPILSAAIPPSRSRVGKDGAGEGLELGILTPHALYIYALGTGRVHARRAFAPAPAGSASRDDGDKEVGTPYAFEAGERVVVVTTHSPPALVILARPSLRVLHVFPAAALAVSHPLTSAADNAGNRLSASFPSSTSPPHASHSPTSPTAEPTPISALHGRLLAFLAPPPTPTSPSVLSNPSTSPGTGEGVGWGRTLGRFFSRSAPAAAGALAATVLAGAGSPPSLAGVAGMASAAAGGAGAWVRVVDLGPLLGGSQAERGGGKGGAGGVRDVHLFDAGRAPLGGLAFSCDGVRLFAVRRDGLGASVWALRPSPSPSPSLSPPDTLPVPAHVYALRRGRTGAVVEAVAGARDGRFVALVTRRRTVHVFAVNPYGGRADVRSHLRARVRDADAGVGASTGGEGGEGPTEVHALVRMRLPPPPQAQEGGEVPPPPAPLAIAFVPASSAGGRTGGLRSPTSPASPASAGSSGVQDVLVFDPADGILSLRRVTLALGAPHGAAGLPISVSLPTGRLSMSASPPASYVRGAATVAEAPGELGGKEAVVATWSLRRKRGWAEIRRVEGGEGTGKGMGGAGRRVKEDWLAQAELSTFTSAPRVLPRAIYLSHQFAFYTLGEDYHALIRRYQFAIGGAKIDVRREVEVSSAYISFAGEAFVEGYAPSSSSSPRAIRRQSHGRAASFDEPLASALAGAHYRDARPPPVLPMLPNGSPASFRSAMPVRAVVAGLGDGVAEGLGRLRREMRHQAQRQRQLARSPQTGGGDDIDASVPLEFDEEDEDFAGPIPGVADEEEVFLSVHADREDDDALSAGTSHSRGGEESVASVSTPATSAHPLEDERVEQLDLSVDTNATEGEWQGWAAEDTQALEEAERFDDISVVGFLDEEQAAMKAEAARRKGTAARTRTKKRRN